MNPNFEQAIEDEEAGIEETEEDINYDEVYGGEEVSLQDYQRPPEVQQSYRDMFTDFAKQAGKETLIGIGGTYGDLFELAGIKKEGQDFPFASTKELRDINTELGGPEEPEGTAGKYGKRIGQLYGSGASFGMLNPGPAILAGVAGQATEDLGGHPLLQGAAEIVSFILAGRSGAGGKLVRRAKDAISNKINQLRNLGYTEQDITLAINAADKGGKAAKIASKGSATEQAFENFAQKSDDLVKNILTQEIPGIEQGTQKVHELASQAYGQVVQEGSKLIIKDTKPFLESVQKVKDYLGKNLGKSDDAKAFIKRLNAAAEAAKKNPTAESMMNFYKELNGMGKWLGRNEKDRLITQVKDGIKDSFRKEGKNGQQLADKFEKVNAGVKKAYDAEELHSVIQKATTQEGIDYKKLYKAFDKPENV